MKTNLIPLPVRIIAAACFITGVVCLLMLMMVAELPVFKDAAPVNAVLGAVLCQPGEHLEREQNSRVRVGRFGPMMTTYCISPSQRRDVTTLRLVVGMGGSSILIIAGFVLLAVTFFINVKSQVKPDTAKVSPPEAAIPKPSLEEAEAAASDQLVQLEAKYKAGLVTTDEYHQMRQEILKKIF